MTIFNINEHYNQHYPIFDNIMSAPCLLDRNTPDIVNMKSLRPFRDEYPRLNVFLDALARITDKFDYLRTSEIEWEERYIFPDKLSVRTDRFNVSEVHSSIYMNKNEDGIVKWIKNFCDDCQSSKKSKYQFIIRSFVTGEIGSGKSTLIKRSIKKHAAKFKAAKLIPARVEFGKLERSKPVEDDKFAETLRLAIIDALYREINYFFSNDLSLASFLDHPRFDEDFYRYLRDGYSGHQSDATYAELETRANEFVNINTAKVRNYSSLSRVDKKTSIWKTDILFKCLVIAYVNDVLDYNFVTIFDGFDYITAEDMLFETRNSNFITALNEIQKGADSFPILDEIKYPLRTHHITIMRDITYSKFMECYGGIDDRELRAHSRIIAPSSKKLTQSAIAKLCTEANLPDLAPKVIEFDKFLRSQVKQMLMKVEYLEGGQVRQKGGKSLQNPNIFNGNARKELYFLRYIIELLLSEILTQEDDIDLHSYTPEMLFDLVDKDEIKTAISSKHYRLLGLLFCRNYRSFQNSIVLPPLLKNSASSISELSGVGNYVDNIYNYDESNTARFALLSKIRVCELLEKRPLSMEEIKASIDENYTNDLERLLAVMCRTDLLKTRWKNNTTLFQTEPLGILTYKYLAKRMEYIEHIFPYICLPNDVRDKSIKVYDRDNTSFRQWSLASVVNGFVLYHCVKSVETEEKAAGKMWSWMAPDIMKNHQVSVFRAVKHFDHNSNAYSNKITSYIENMSK